MSQNLSSAADVIGALIQGVISLQDMTSYYKTKHIALHQWIRIVLIQLDRQQSKTLTLLTNIDKKWLETKFLIAICRRTGDKWQSKTLFLAIFDPRSSIVKSVLNCGLSSVLLLKKKNYFQQWPRRTSFKGRQPNHMSSSIPSLVCQIMLPTWNKQIIWGNVINLKSTNV